MIILIHNTCLLKGIYLLLPEQRWSTELELSKINLRTFFNLYCELLQSGLEAEKNMNEQPTPYSDTMVYYNDRLFGSANTSGEISKRS